LIVDAPDNQGGSLKTSDIAESFHDGAFRMNGLIAIPAAS
jgi:hypothetical protein